MLHKLRGSNRQINYGEDLTENRKAGYGETEEEAKENAEEGATTVTAEENGYIYVEAEDENGNKVTKTIEITNIDKGLPTVTLEPNGETYVIPSEGTATIGTKVTAEDALSGIDEEKLYYAWSQDNEQAPEEWTEFTNGDTINKEGIEEEGAWYLWTKVTDNAGNEATNVSEAFIVGDHRVTYIVNHYKQNIDGTYPASPEETQSATVQEGEEVTPGVKTYEGFTSPEAQTVEITNENKVINYQYVRNTYTVSVDKKDGIESVIGDGDHKYGEEVTLGANLKAGYENAKWTSNEQPINNKFTMPATALNVEVSADLITYTIGYELNGGAVEEIILEL